MHIVLVHVHVRAEFVEDFKRVTEENACSSLLEPGVARFDVIQQQDDPTRFVLVEVYRQPGDPALHKQTAHYLTWKDRVTPYMAEPRQGIAYTNVFPDDQNW